MHKPKLSHQTAIYEASNPHSPSVLEQRRDEQLDARWVRWAGVGAAVVGVLVLISPQVRSEVRAFIPGSSATGSNPTRTELAKDRNHVLSLTTDPGHPGLDKLIYKYGPNQTGTSAIAAEVAPAEDAGQVEIDLKTYPDFSPVVHENDTMAFEINDATGNIVPNPN